MIAALAVAVLLHSQMMTLRAIFCKSLMTVTPVMMMRMMVMTIMTRIQTLRTVDQ